MLYFVNLSIFSICCKSHASQIARLLCHCNWSHAAYLVQLTELQREKKRTEHINFRSLENILNFQTRKFSETQGKLKLLNSQKDNKLLIYIKRCVLLLQFQSLIEALKVNKVPEYWFPNPMQLLLKQLPFLKYIC